MATVRPFRAFRPRPEIAHRVSSPPYDVIDTAEARALADGKPESFLHVTRPEIDLPVGTDEHDDRVYEKARENLAAMCAEGVLRRTPSRGSTSTPSDMGGHHQVGVVGCVSVRRVRRGPDQEAREDPRRQGRRPHAPRRRALRARRAGVPHLPRERRDRRDGPPRRRARSALRLHDRRRRAHRLWALDPEASRALASLFDDVSELYVADGHHRSAAASRVHANAGDGGEHDVFLAVVFPHDQVQILPTTASCAISTAARVDALRAELEAIFERRRPPTRASLQGGVRPLPRRPLVARARAAQAASTRAIRSRRSTAASARISCSGRSSRHGSAPRRPRGVRRRHPRSEGVARRVDEGRATLGVVLFPTSVNELIAVSDRGLLMPPKSTWFEPKLESGLFVHVF
jgi:uncharacterized protein (DUF1015 family)